MFKRRAPPTEPTFAGWRDAHLRYLAEKVTRGPEGQPGLLGINITGISNTTKLNGYSLQTGMELVGHCSWPPARVEGGFDTVDGFEDDKMGAFTITGKGDGDGPYTPLIYVNFSVTSKEQEAQLIATLQAALSGNGSAWLNLSLRPLDEADPEAWVAHVKTHGWSPQVAITGVVVGTQFGGPFD